MELREGLGHACFVIDGDRTVGTERGDLQGHDHAVVVVGGVGSAFEETGSDRSLGFARDDSGGRQ